MFSTGQLLGSHLEARAEGQTHPTVKLTMVNQCQVDPGQTLDRVLRRPCELVCTREAGFLPALAAVGLPRRDGNKLHSCPLPCLSCCLRQRPAFLTPPRGIHCDSKTSTKSKAKGSHTHTHLLTQELTRSAPVDTALFSNPYSPACLHIPVLCLCPCAPIV